MLTPALGQDPQSQPPRGVSSTFSTVWSLHQRKTWGSNPVTLSSSDLAGRCWSQPTRLPKVGQGLEPWRRRKHPAVFKTASSSSQSPTNSGGPRIRTLQRLPVPAFQAGLVPKLSRPPTRREGDSNSQAAFRRPLAFEASGLANVPISPNYVTGDVGDPRGLFLFQSSMPVLNVRHPLSPGHGHSFLVRHAETHRVWKLLRTDWGGE